MSNKNFEDKVLKALGNIGTDVSVLKEDVARLDKKIDNVEFKLTKRIDGLDAKIDTVESSLIEKMDKQTYDLKQTMNVNTHYLNQAFEQISKIDKERFMEKNNIRYDYV